MPVPQSWRDAVVQQQQEKPYKTINKVFFRQLAVSWQAVGSRQAELRSLVN